MKTSSISAKTMVLTVVCTVFTTWFGFGTSNEVHGAPLVFGGARVSAASLLGDSGCAMSSGGPISCKTLSSSDSLLSNLGPLAGQTIIDFSGDSSTSCAISGSFVAYCWGSNSEAAVGDNTTTDRDIPTPVFVGGALAGVNLKKIAANYSGACAISTIGRLYCWGASTPSGGSGIYDRFYTGQSPSTRLIPPTAVTDSQLTSLTWADVEAIGSSTICAMSTTRAFKCFGASIVTYTTSAIPSNEAMVSMSAASRYGDMYACALSNAGNVYCNGGYYFRPATAAANQSTFSQVALPTSATSIRVADGIACAVLSNGGVSCWGFGMQRSVGLGVTGYPVVELLPAGSGVSEATALSQYGSYPRIIVRKSNGQLQTFDFTSNNVGTNVPTGEDASLETPKISLTKLDVQLPGEYSSSCTTQGTNVCVFIEAAIDDFSSSSIEYKVYSDSGLSVLEKSGFSELQYGEIGIGTVGGQSGHWVTLTVRGPYGTTTTSAMEIPRQYWAPSSARISTTVDNYPGCFDLSVNEDVSNGGLEGSWTYTIKNLQTGSRITWNGYNGCLSFLKTSSRYNIQGTFSTILGSTTATSTFTTANLRMKRSAYKSSRFPLKSLFLVHSPGRQSWSASKGCSVRGGYLVTGSTYSCVVKLKVSAAKGFVASTNSFIIRLF